MKIKICRIRSKAEVSMLHQLNVDFLGVHYRVGEPNPSMQNVVELVEYARQISGPEPILLTKAVDIVSIVEMVAQTGVRMVQMHRPTSCAELDCLQSVLHRYRFDPISIVPVFVGEESDQSEAQRIIRHESVPFAILDASYRGGTGISAPLTTIIKWRDLIGENFLLAGGISVDNAGKYWKTIYPMGFDVQSSVENESRSSKVYSKLQNLAVELDTLDRDNRRESRSSFLAVAIDESVTCQEIAKLTNAGVCHYHFDLSDGTITPKFVSMPFPQCRYLNECCPVACYDLHMFSNELNNTIRYLRMMLETNTNLRQIILHSETPVMVARVVESMHALVSEGFKCGISIHATTFDIEQAAATMQICQQYGGVSFGIVLHSARREFSELQRWLQGFVEMSAEVRDDCRATPVLWGDRDINAQRLTLLKELAFDGVVMGRAARQLEPNDLVSKIVAWNK